MDEFNDNVEALIRRGVSNKVIATSLAPGWLISQDVDPAKLEVQPEAVRRACKELALAAATEMAQRVRNKGERRCFDAESCYTDNVLRCS